ncbi:type VI secretion system Vgr family protein [Limobrevibacterium gyesilva]|uniref:Type VI secretion system tip protein VgrG n=1 Tax=Limobrevibacterium gyesilva TaxID=2991712 RepID=A0AA41YNT2_9PROT|nr:type VI secretion system tip protein TssI/VgrG [Limobrevibacterium gyesilva]MCW3473903.1 type VI secretion system tip protein VgrG [Limobrevibacterium gyesilva]
MSGSAAKRLLTMTSPGGVDAMVPVGLRMTEAISEPFTLNLEMTSAGARIDPDKMLFQPVCVTLEFDEAEGLTPRHFHGIVRSFGAQGTAGQAAPGGAWTYTAEVVPRLWFLHQTTDCRIWQNKSAIDVVKAIFEEAGHTAVEWNITGAPPVRETITQFNETDFDFVSRLLEEEGCFYFFKHASSDHTLVIANDKNVFKDITSAAAMKIDTASGTGWEAILGWRRCDSTALGKVSLLDYDPETPNTLVKAEETTVLKTGGATKRDFFTWPALSLKADVVKTRARYRMEAAEAGATLMEGTGAQPHFTAGGKFTVQRAPTGVDTGVFVVRSVIHTATDDTDRSGGGGAHYANSFTAFPARATWRQPLTVPRPRMAGIHTALVIGPDDSEIFTDKYSRVQIRFYWDHRSDAKPLQDSCWVRVIQPWSGTVAGDNWGWHHMPRVGTEVAVSFMDGDPDRPVVVGCFYNGVAMPVFDLSNRDTWTKSGMRSRSATSADRGTGEQYSEFSFDDKKGSELVFLHAQKDYFTEVENNQTLDVQNCRIVTVKNDETIDIGKSETVTIGKGRSVTVKDKNDELTVSTGDLTVTTTQGKMGFTANSDYALLSKTGNITTKASTGNISTQASLGNITMKADTGAVTIEALQSITLKCGPSTLTIDPSGITLKGMMITIKGDTMTSVEGLMTTVKGNAMLTLKGGLVMLN